MKAIFHNRHCTPQDIDKAYGSKKHKWFFESGHETWYAGQSTSSEIGTE